MHLIRESARRLGPAGLVALLFFAGVEVGLHALPAGAAYAHVLSATGVLLGVLLVVPRRAWIPAALLVFLLAPLGEVAGGGDWATEARHEALFISSLALSAFVLTRRFGSPVRLDSPRTLLAVFAVPLAAWVAISVLPAVLSGRLASARLISAWVIGWLDDALGLLVVTPALLSWTRGERPRGPGRGAEMALLFAGAAGAMAAVFRLGLLHPTPLLLPFVVWAAVRFGLREASALSLAVTAVFWRESVEGLGPFADLGAPQTMFQLQAFLGVLSFSGAILALTVERHRRAEADKEALLLAERRAAHLWTDTFNALGDAILVVDRDGTIRRSNRAASLLAGGEPAHLTGSPLGRVSLEPPLREALELVAQTAGSARSGSTSAREPGGRSWEVVATPLPEPGSPLLVAIHDTTHVVALQERLHRKETLEALGAVVAGVAHEVRTPLFSISATVDVMETLNGKPEDLAAHLANLRLGVTRLGVLMNDLLELGRPVRPQAAPVPLASVLAAAVEGCAAPAETARVAILRQGIGEDETVRADVPRLALALRNVLENAIQHSRAGDAVVVETALAEIEGRAAVEVAVRDRGPGVRSDILPRIFEPFFSGRRGGTGLGMSIVKRVVEEHGGTVGVSNLSGGGARVALRLPLAT